MRGRFWLAASLLTLALGAGVPGVVAQPGEKVARIGVLSGVRPDTDMTEGCTSFLRRGLQELGYIEGQTLRLEVRWSDGLVEPFPRLAADLVRRNVDVIAVTSTAIEAAKHATSTIPLVMTSSSYPVERGFIASLARPGGNITGLATHTGQLMAKRVQILKEAIPAASRLAVLRIPGHVQDLFVSDIEAAAKQKYELVVNLKTARTLGLTLPQSILLRADRVIE